MSSANDNHEKPWRFVTNHTQVMLAIARNPDARMREIADLVGITERAAQRIVEDLTDEGYLDYVRIGRRNHYTINRERSMRHPAQVDHEIGRLLHLLSSA